MCPRLNKARARENSIEGLEVCSFPKSDRQHTSSLSAMRESVTWYGGGNACERHTRSRAEHDDAIRDDSHNGRHISKFEYPDSNAEQRKTLRQTHNADNTQTCAAAGCTPSANLNLEERRCRHLAVLVRNSRRPWRNSQHPRRRWIFFFFLNLVTCKR